MPFYDTFADQAPTRPGRWILERLNEHHAGVLAGLRPEIRSVLEIGPGAGAFADACIGRGLRYSAVEPNARLAAAIRARGCDVSEDFAPPIHFPDGAFDCVHAAHVLEHSPTFREALELLREVRRVLVPGGCASIVVPDFDHAGPEFYRADYSHSYPLTLRRLRQLLGDSGFGTERAEFLSGPFRGPARLLTQTAAWIARPWMIRCLSLGRLSETQAYSAKLTFLRAVWVVARRND